MLMPMEPFDEDAQLMVRYRDGDAAAFAALYARHKGPLYRYLLRQVRNAGAAADLFQEVWSRLIAARARYRARKIRDFSVSHSTQLHHRLFRRDLMMSRAARSDDPQAQAAEPEVPEYERPDGLAEFAERQSALLAALGALPREQREAFLLHEETGLTIEEIARISDVDSKPPRAGCAMRYAN